MIRGVWSRRLALAALLTASGCAHVKRVEGLEQKLAEAPGGFISGTVSGLEQEALLDNKDFVYAIALSPDGERAAFTRLAGKTFNLSLWSLRPTPDGKPASAIADVVLNDYEFDVEGLDFSPDGKTVVTAGRDGVVRFWSSADGKKLGEFFADEPLVSAAFLPDGRRVVVGSARGLLTLLSWPELAWVSDVRGHTDEVRAIAGTPDGRVVTGSWDKSIAVFEIVDAPLSAVEVRLSVNQLSRTNTASVVRAGLNGKVGLFLYDAAQPLVLVSSELAKAAGIDPALLTETVTTSTGQQARVARGQTVQLKHLRVENVDVAVCDACVPKGAHGILGAPVLGRFEIKANPAVGELTLTAREVPDVAEVPLMPTLREVTRHTMPAFVNDLSIDRSGARLGVAMSNEKAERNREVYQREKRGDPAPEHPMDVAAIVTVEDGKIVRQWDHHSGVVSTAGISPDGKTVASGGWDKLIIVQDERGPAKLAEQELGWSLRRIRFSRDGRLLAVGAWTPQKAVGNMESDPSAIVYEVLYSDAKIDRGQATLWFLDLRGMIVRATVNATERQHRKP